MSVAQYAVEVHALLLARWRGPLQNAGPFLEFDTAGAHDVVRQNLAYRLFFETFLPGPDVPSVLPEQRPSCGRFLPA